MDQRFFCLFVCLLFWLSFFQEGQDRGSGQGVRSGGSGPGIRTGGSGPGIRTGGQDRGARTGVSGQGGQDRGNRTGGQDRGVRTGGLEQETDPVCLVVCLSVHLSFVLFQLFTRKFSWSNPDRRTSFRNCAEQVRTFNNWNFLWKENKTFWIISSNSLAKSVTLEPCLSNQCWENTVGDCMPWITEHFFNVPTVFPRL